jgi:uncharacterized protein (DUF4415 family)
MTNAKPKVRSISDEEEARIQAGIARDPNNPELTDEQLAAMRPAREVLPPALYDALTRRKPGQRGPGKKPAKVSVTLRLDPEVVAAFKAGGAGWQARINDVLRKAVGGGGSR